MVDSTNFIDVHIPSTRVLIEQKSIDKDLRAPVPQSRGGKLTPFQQAKKYVANMPLSQHPKWIVTCNFAEFLAYDMGQPNGEPEQFFLKDLGKEYCRLQFLVDMKSEHITKEMQVPMKAGEIVGRIYDALLKQYDDNHGQSFLGFEETSPVKVSIHQFYGIEINEFAVTVASTALWISEAQMQTKTEQIVQHDIDFLPLKSYANIKEDKALHMKWCTLEKETATPCLYAKKLNVFKMEELPEEVLSSPSMVS